MSRCVSGYETRALRCMERSTAAHDEHWSWDHGEMVTWRTAPAGPQNQAEWLAAAEALEDGLGLRFDVYNQEDGPFLYIVDEDLKKWWGRNQTGEKIMGRVCRQDDGCQMTGHRDKHGHHV